MKNKLGYCCINTELSAKGINTGRDVMKKNYTIEKASSLGLLNVLDLKKIIEWNNLNGIRMYRITSELFPWDSEYEFQDLKCFYEVSEILMECGNLARKDDQRLTMHPGHFSVIASLKSEVVTKAIKDLRHHAEIMDLMGLTRNSSYPINIHVNTAQPNKEDAAERFCRNFELLPENVRCRLVLENDDKKSLFTASELYDLIHKRIGIPLTFDYFHYKCNPDEERNSREALELCLSTWPNGIRPITHYSDSKKTFEDNLARTTAHSDWIWEKKVETYDLEFDIEFEVKRKQEALIKYINDGK